MRKLRVLIVSPTCPYPPSFGFGMRVYQLAAHLSARHDVTLLTYARNDELAYVDALRDELADVRVVEKSQQHCITKRLSQLASIMLRESYVVRDLRTAAMQEAIDELALGEPFDVVQVESSQLCGLRYDTRSPIVLDEHNIEYELLERMHEGERSLDAPLLQPCRVPEAAPGRATSLEERRWVRGDVGQGSHDS